MRISDWSSDVCSSDLLVFGINFVEGSGFALRLGAQLLSISARFIEIGLCGLLCRGHFLESVIHCLGRIGLLDCDTLHQNAGTVLVQDFLHPLLHALLDFRSEEHTSELQSLMRISYAVFCLKHKSTY